MEDILSKITSRQSEIVVLYGQGKCYKEIARTLGISWYTVANHLRNARERTGCGSSVQVATKVAVAMERRG
jgi:DNA-binding NarL/FixJ family response regulator